MVRLWLLGCFHATRLTLGWLSQFGWFQAYMSFCARVMTIAFKFWLWGMLFVLIGWLFWDILPLVALGFMAFHIYNWRCREVW